MQCGSISVVSMHCIGCSEADRQTRELRFQCYTASPALAVQILTAVNAVNADHMLAVRGMNELQVEWSGCRGNLKDQVLDWEDALPEEQLEAAEDHANTADLVLCLGTSLQIRPICNLPMNTKRQGGKIIIVNLQKTPKNKAADIVIHARCDQVMQCVMNLMGRTIPCYDRWDHFQMRFWMVQAKVAGKRARQESASVCIQTVSQISCFACGSIRYSGVGKNRLFHELQHTRSTTFGICCFYVAH